MERFGGIDMVLANAGIASYGSVLAVDPETFARVIEVNVIGVFNTVRAALPSVIERRGYILIVSSLAAFAPSAGLAAYNASKAGVEHFANALRLEVAHRGVDVGSAHMSWIDTPLVQDAKADLPSFSRMLATLPDAAGPDDLARRLRAGFRARPRRAPAPRLRPALGGAAGVAAAGAELARRRPGRARARGRPAAGDGRGGAAARAEHQRPQRRAPPSGVPAAPTERPERTRCA